ncbi:hypothetical protein B0O99DRAFT_615524 [Bisporella sp. PMI_857]|nr:hypothetical protein B0O99DRAFT_615524 [Bisporella sp. PMI_857]
MFKRKPTTQPQTPIRTYKITLPTPTTSPSKASNPLLPQRHLLIARTLPPSPPITYSLTITTTSLPSLSEFELLLQNTSTTNNATTTAKTQVSLSNNQTDLFFSEKAQKIEMNLTSNWKYKNYATSLLLPPGYSDDPSQSKEIELLWKGTNDVKGLCTCPPSLVLLLPLFFHHIARPLPPPPFSKRNQTPYSSNTKLSNSSRFVQQRENSTAE